MKKSLEISAAAVVALLLVVMPLQATDPLEEFVDDGSSNPECSTGTPLECERVTTTTCLRYVWVKLDGTVSPTGGGGAGYTRECQLKQEKVQTKYWSR